MMLSRQPTKVSNEWELDFYSRPVQGPDGKKLWELLVTDAQGTFQHVEAVPSNCVNSRELRARVQRLIDDTPLKPKKIRFFRTQMKNMISIALNELPDVLALPSRATYQLYDWIDERQREVPPTSDELVAATAPYYRHAIECFGVERCMFESNFPVDKQSCSYHVLYNAFKKLVADASADEKRQLFHDTAARVYRI